MMSPGKALNAGTEYFALTSPQIYQCCGEPISKSLCPWMSGAKATQSRSLSTCQRLCHVVAEIVSAGEVSDRFRRYDLSGAVDEGIHLLSNLGPSPKTNSNDGRLLLGGLRG